MLTLLPYLLIGTPILIVVGLFVALVLSAALAPTLSERPRNTYDE